ncbi:hypothetical protein Tco_0209501 [Tanacetum coccineum]
MSTLAEFMILSGADNHPPMLEKHLYDSWKSIMELYMQNREHGRMILESVEHGPLIWTTIEENGVTRTKKYEKLSTTEKIQADSNLKATNIILQGLSSDVYSLVNHHRVAKDLWERFQLLMQVNQQTHLAEFSQIEFGLEVLVFKQRDDPIDAINKMMSFFSREQSLFAAGTSRTRANISGIGGNNSGQQRVVKCFNWERSHARQCPKPNRKRDATWFWDKVLLVEAQGSGKVLNKEELEFLADPGVAEAKAVFMANLSSYGSDVLSKNKITSDSNIIPYSQYLLETQNADVQDTNFSAQLDAMILSVFEQLSNQVTNCNKVNNDNLIANKSLFAELERYKERVKLLEERQNVDLSSREKLIMDDTIREKNAQFADFEKEINYLKQTLSDQSKEKELLTKTFNVFKNESKEKEAKNIAKEIALEKKVKELDNIVCKMGQSAQIKAQQIRLMLYDGSVIAKETNVISITDSEETLMLEEEYFVKHFIPQQELSDEQVFRYKLHTLILTNLLLRLSKLRLLGNFLRRGWGFEHTKAVFLKEIIPFVKTLKDIFNVFDKDLLNKVRPGRPQGKDIVDNVAQVLKDTTIAPGMYKLAQVTLAPKDKNNRETHIYYLKY